MDSLGGTILNLLYDLILSAHALHAKKQTYQATTANLRLCCKLLGGIENSAPTLYEALIPLLGVPNASHFEAHSCKWGNKLFDKCYQKKDYIDHAKESACTAMERDVDIRTTREGI